jgi:NAD(P)-dependent dehydrogenase (short-subunit alcohol dehydrogenase family)
VAADLSTVREVRRAAAEIRERLDRIDTLVNNAGGTFPKHRTETVEGLELTFAVQYGFYGPKLQRQQPSWARSHPELGSALWHETEALLREMDGPARHRTAAAPNRVEPAA